MDLDRFRIPLEPAPDRIQNLIRNGVVHGRYPVASSVPALLDGPEPPAEGVWRAADGSALIVCNTDFPNTSPAMLDWWFGWHLASTERYQLWHPTAHVSARVMEDRSHLTGHRARYLDNESYVDEFVGHRLKHLTIRFVAPQHFGFDDLDVRGATAICATTSDRFLHAAGGYLCHLVLPTSQGSQMRSAFWLGNIRHQWPWVHGLLSGLYNSSFLRRRLVSDRFCLDLLRHCSEEMNHLARILPALYQEMEHG
jgi:hypothetical protein